MRKETPAPVTAKHTRNNPSVSLTLKPRTLAALRERAAANDESLSKMADTFLRRAMGVK